ncbi:MAG: helix-turn-helix transcriptional regulator [Oscillospiraceae bacterium]|nr:helix-turn-helix transcriptional regulator [Oscillospiraceae bacterium]
MTNTSSEKALTLGQKIKSARTSAGLTQEQLAVALSVSRQAITKWESDKGMPDIENLKNISKVLSVSLDYLLNDSTELDLRVIREEIKLGDVSVFGKQGRKNAIVSEKFGGDTIYALRAEKRLTKGESFIGNMLGFLTDAPFGVPEMINNAKDASTSYFLVEKAGAKLLVAVTDEFMETRQLSCDTSGKRFDLGEYRFVKTVKL